MTIPCECGCGHSGQRHKMHPVRITDGPPRRGQRGLYRHARSYLVLPACVRAFKAELLATRQCRASTEALLTLPRWRRLAGLPRLWALRRAILVRRTGEKAARAKAWSLVWFLLRSARLPDSLPVPRKTA
jgi:hypothetical protein